MHLEPVPVIRSRLDFDNLLGELAALSGKGCRLERDSSLRFGMTKGKDNGKGNRDTTRVRLRRALRDSAHYDKGWGVQMKKARC